MSDKEVLARAVDLRQIGGERLNCEFQRLFLEHLAVSDDGVERRSQFMAHAGEEIALCLACSLRRLFRASEFLLGDEAVVNVRVGPEPFRDSASRVADGQCAAKMPSILPICALQAELDFIRFTAREGRAPMLATRLEVVRMYKTLPTGAKNAGLVDAEVITRAFVHIIERSVGACGPDLLRYRFREHTVVPLGSLGTRQQIFAFALMIFALGYVPQVGREKDCVLNRNPIDGEFNRKLRTIGSEGRKLDALSQHRAFPGA